MRPCSQALYDQGRESLAWLFTWRKETNDYLNILIKQGTSQYQRKKSELYCLSKLRASGKKLPTKFLLPMPTPSKKARLPSHYLLIILFRASFVETHFPRSLKIAYLLNFPWSRFRRFTAIYWKIVMAAPASVTKMYVDQLRTEANMERVPVSTTAAALCKYVEQNLQQDPLVTGVSSSVNPYKEKSSCLIF